MTPFCYLKHATSPKTRQGVAASLAGLVLAACPLAASAQTSVYQELILSLDVSGSIDMNEYDLQKDGWHAAFSDPEVKARLFSPAVLSAGGTAIGVAQWSSSGQQTMALPTMAIYDEPTYTSFLSQLSAMPRVYMGNTCVSCGINVGVNDLLTNSFQTPAGMANRMIIDLSGDGTNNSGGNPLTEKANAEALGIIVNALAIEDPSLVSYFQNNVATMATMINGGTKAGFVEFANSFSSFDDAAKLKLMKELNPPSEAPAGLPLLGVAAAFGSIRKLRRFSSELQPRAKA